MRIHHLLVGTSRAGAALGLTAALAFTCAVAATPASASELTSRHHGRVSHSVDITGIDFGYRINTHGGVGAGLVEIRFHNRGREDHQAQLFRLNDGVTPDKFKADLASGNLGSIFADSVPAGGAAVLRARDSQPVWDPLQGGTYAVVCFVPDTDGVPHFAKGMVGFFTVSGTVAPATLAALHPRRAVEGVITSHDLTYTMPKVLERNEVYEFVDTDSADVHEVNLGRLKLPASHPARRPGPGAVLERGRLRRGAAARRPRLVPRGRRPRPLRRLLPGSGRQDRHPARRPRHGRRRPSEVR
jgi:hypothetical protein